MKKVVLLIILAAVTLSCTNKVALSEIEEKSGRYFYKGEPFSGVLFDKNSDDVLIKEFEVKDGRENGFYREFDDNGKKLIEKNLLNNNFDDGHFAFYYRLDQWKTSDSKEVVHIEGTLKNGKLVGEYINNYDLYSRRTNTNDFYYEKYILDNDGKVLSWERKRDSDGKVIGKYNFNKDLNYGLKVEYFQNGQLQSSLKYSDYKLEFIDDGIRFIDGKFGDVIGDYITFYENGQIYEKGRYKNGLKKGLWITYYDNGRVKQKINYDQQGTPQKINYNEQGKTFNATISYDENGQIY